MSASTTQTFVPKDGVFAVLKIDPVASLAFLNDPEAIRAAEMVAFHEYVVFVPGTGQFRHPSISYREEIVEFLMHGPAPDTPELGIDSAMCIPVSSTTDRPPVSREPLEPSSGQLPWSNCYLTAFLRETPVADAVAEQSDSQQLLPLPPLLHVGRPSNVPSAPAPAPRIIIPASLPARVHVPPHFYLRFVHGTKAWEELMKRMSTAAKDARTTDKHSQDRLPTPTQDTLRRFLLHLKDLQHLPEPLFVKPKAIAASSRCCPFPQSATRSLLTLCGDQGHPVTPMQWAEETLAFLKEAVFSDAVDPHSAPVDADNSDDEVAAERTAIVSKLKATAAAALAAVGAPVVVAAASNVFSDRVHSLLTHDCIASLSTQVYHSHNHQLILVPLLGIVSLLTAYIVPFTLHRLRSLTVASPWPLGAHCLSLPIEPPLLEAEHADADEEGELADEAASIVSGSSEPSEDGASISDGRRAGVYFDPRVAVTNADDGLTAEEKEDAAELQFLDALLAHRRPQEAPDDMLTVTFTHDLSRVSELRSPRLFYEEQEEIERIIAESMERKRRAAEAEDERLGLYAEKTAFLLAARGQASLMGVNEDATLIPPTVPGPSSTGVLASVLQFGKRCVSLMWH
ncbi:hypothetical protein HMN09_00938300 [Mycena chlorophos]|uniref:Uncharacterized protein n=1 Tax=Mycena chlorophos TaxID=658473 RepID=A0A8H6SKW2_MYCCL|nr:hypothetical protein HMN09_00938300 [Mycena chlorophos]